LGKKENFTVVLVPFPEAQEATKVCLGVDFLGRMVEIYNITFDNKG